MRWIRVLFVVVTFWLTVGYVSCATTDTCPPDANGEQEESCLEARRTFWQAVSDLIVTGGARANDELEEAGDD
jgi:hypothetical protein